MRRESDLFARDALQRSVAVADKESKDLDLSRDDVLAKCLAEPDLEAALALHERYYLHHHAASGRSLADAKARIDEHLAAIAKIHASVAAARNDATQVAFADSNGREAIEKHFAAKKAA
jgi:hypothetical protein